MSAVEPTLAAVLERPDDLLARLLHAEVLEARGDPRGELIRVQCALASETGRSARIGLRQRETALLRAHGRRWLAPVRAMRGKGELRRGFIEKVTVPLWKGLPPGLAALFAQEPVRDVDLGYSQKNEPILEFFAMGLLGRLTHLRMAASEALVARLAEAEGAEGLRYLGLRGYALKDTGLGLLATAPRLAGLEELCVGGVTDAGLATLCSGGRRWRSLYLSSSKIRGAGLQTLVASPAMEGLRVLCLNRCEGVDDDGLMALAASPASASLTILELERTGLTAKGARALVQSPYLAGLTRLRVRDTGAAKGATLVALRARWPRAVIV